MAFGDVLSMGGTMLRAKGECTTIAEKMKIVGDVTANGKVEVKGEVVGNLTVEGSVEVKGLVEGEIHCTSLMVVRNARMTTADSVVVDGWVEGPIRAAEVVLKAQAHVTGDITCQAVVIERGAFVEGRLLRSMGLKGTEVDEAALEALEVRREEDARSMAASEASTRKAELVVEARHLSGNPDLHIDEALAFLAKRGNTQAKAILAEERSAKGA